MISCSFSPRPFLMKADIRLRPFPIRIPLVENRKRQTRHFPIVSGKNILRHGDFLANGPKCPKSAQAFIPEIPGSPELPANAYSGSPARGPHSAAEPRTGPQEETAGLPGKRARPGRGHPARFARHGRSPMSIPNRTRTGPVTAPHPQTPGTRSPQEGQIPSVPRAFRKTAYPSLDTTVTPHPGQTVSP